MLKQLILLLLVTYASSSHYRGGSVSWDIRQSDYVNGSSTVPVRVYQRHSWRRSAALTFWNAPECDTSTIANRTALLGENFLVCESNGCSTSVSNLYRSIPTQVLCTDFSVDYDYASGENYTTLQLPINERLTYTYASCCWIGLLPNNGTPSWGLNLIIDTHRRLNGKFNNAPVSTMNPIVKVEVGGTYLINIPMADIDGDQLRCRWGVNANESGGIYQSKGDLQSNPCQLTYNARRVGYEGVAVIIEDFDTNSQVLSSIPLQFLIEIVPSQPTTTKTTTFPGQVTGTFEPGLPELPPCPYIPEYEGDWGPGACIGVASNNMTEIQIVVKISCENSSTSIRDILTISPTGMIRGPITQHPQYNNKYIMILQWTPQANQYGISQLCVTPVDNSSRSGQTVCFSLLVDVRSPEFVLNSMSPTGIVSQNQSTWTIATNVDIIPPTDPSISAIFYKRNRSGSGRDIEVIRVSMSTADYQSRQITFNTGHTIWEQGQEYYILFDAGVATINQSCGIQSSRIIDTQFWTFYIAAAPTTTTIPSTSTTTTLIPSTSTTSTPIPSNSTTTTPIPPCFTTTTPIPSNSTTTTPIPSNSTTTIPIRSNSTTTTPIPSNFTTTTPIPSNSTSTTSIPSNSTTTTPIASNSTTNTPVPSNSTTTIPIRSNYTTSTPVSSNSTTTTPIPSTSTSTTSIPSNSTTTTPVPSTSTSTTSIPSNSTTTTPVPSNSTTTTPIYSNSTTTTPITSNFTTTTPIPSTSTSTTSIPSNSTTNTPIASNSTTNTPVSSNSTTTTPIHSNSTTTTPIPSNSTTTTPIPSNSTTTTPIQSTSTSTTSIPSNSTTTTPIHSNSTTTTPIPSNSTITTPIPPCFTTTTPIPSNSTTTTPIPSNSTTTIPIRSNSTTTTPIASNSTTNTPVPSNSTTTTPIPSTSTSITSITSNSTTTTPINSNSTTTTPILSSFTTTTPIPSNFTTTTPIPSNSTTTTPIPSNSTTTAPIPSTSTTTPEETTTATIPSTTVSTSSSTTIKETTTYPTTLTTATPSNLVCSEWLPFGTIKNIITNDKQQNYSFCFYVNTTLADVTVSANTWTSCATWKKSGAADPLIDFYNITNYSILLAQNDDGNSMSELNCYAAVISYRLYRGSYQVIIRHAKCDYGRFEVRLSAETTNAFK